MKRIVLSALALAILAAPMAQAHAASTRSYEPRIEDQRGRPGASHGHSVHRKMEKHHRYERGQRFTNWKRYESRDWKRHGLRKPGHGQRWIRVGNDYMLITIASGIIAGVIAGR